MALSFRFSPPHLEIPAAVRWLLAAALGSADSAGAAGPPPAEVALWARRLDLEARLAHRLGRAGLETALGPELAEQLMAVRRRCAVGAMLAQELGGRLAATAREADIPIILLKGAALLELGITAAGARRLADVDVLVPRRDARRLNRLLEGQGFRPSAADDSRQHLAPASHPRLGLVEVHLFLRGVRIHHRRATATDLLDAGLCRAAPTTAGALVPRKPLLTAHLLAHGLHQHGFSPHAYPMSRLIADLADLGKDTEELAALIQRAEPYLRRRVSRRELDAAAALVRDLTRGVLPETATDAATLLRHILAGSTDAAYRARLKRRAARSALARGDWYKVARRLRLTVGSRTPRPAADPAHRERGFVRVRWGRSGPRGAPADDRNPE